MKYLSVCSGIEAVSCAWESLGFVPVGFSEIEAFPSAVLVHRFPTVKNYGDMTKYKEWENVGKFDILVGGTPCQTFSIAGLRKGLSDPRGNLMLTFGAMADHFKPTWIVWENVPGVLSSHKGKDFGTFLGMLGELGYGFAYRVLDAQYYGVAQRRRRVFVVGYLGDWRPPAKVLFESEGLCGHSAPSREARQEAPVFTPSSFGGYSEGVGSLRAKGGDLGGGSENLICFEPGVMSRDGGHIYHDISGTIRSNPGDNQMSVMCFEPRSPDGCARISGNIAPTLNRMGGGQREPCIMATGQGNAEIGIGRSPTLNCNHEAPILALAWNTIGREPENGGNGVGCQEDISYTLTKTDRHGVMQGAIVRRLTTIECERLQGFSDGWTKIPWRKKSADDCPDGPRYKALGNSMAVPVMRWIGKRLQSN